MTEGNKEEKASVEGLEKAREVSVKGAEREREREGKGGVPPAEADLHAAGPWWQGSKTPLALQAMWISAIPLRSACMNTI